MPNEKTNKPKQNIDRRVKSIKGKEGLVASKEQESLDQVFPEEIKEILDSIPDAEKREKLELFVCRYRFFSGPLPPPEDLNRYDQIIKNGAERIMKRAERQSAHRMEIEKIAIKEQLKQSGKGQNFGFILAILFLIASIVLAMTGHETVASIIGGTTLVSITAVFVTDRRKE